MTRSAGSSKPSRRHFRNDHLFELANTRGWTSCGTVAFRCRSGFPAHAGMDRDDGIVGLSVIGLPRTRGDGPAHPRHRCPGFRASPHTRGWTPPGSPHQSDDHGFPAHAGMDPGGTRPTPMIGRLPRTRGDGPLCDTDFLHMDEASPHTRGWTPDTAHDAVTVVGFPAHAGMDPHSTGRSSTATRLPRTRGDGPVEIPLQGLFLRASPHTRGWTRHGPHPRPEARGFPAHAGMDPGKLAPADRPAWLPRTRGDGPPTPTSRCSVAAASPHTRGWTWS